MRIAGRVGWIALVAGVSFALISPASQAGSNNTFRCGKYRSATRMVSYDIACADAQKVFDTWKRLCNNGRRCVKEIPSLNQKFSCSGHKRQGDLRMRCNSRENQAYVRFRVRS